jgi:S-adenosylmethionine hydrolase
MPPIITITSDFGMRDTYVAAMKGVILSLNRAVQIIDITHEIPPQDIRRGALCVMGVHRYFPAGTIHIVVVDPGVGSDRPLICVSMHDQLFLAPDNGVLSWAARGARSIDRVILFEERFWVTEISATFHGRDILAPVAAHLTLGVLPRQLGRPVDLWVELPWPSPDVRDDRVNGELLLIDHFGNLITNIGATDIPGNPASHLVSCGRTDRIRLVRTYADGKEGELIALVGSMGLLEIAVRNGNAAERLGAQVGTQVSVRVRS